MSSRVSSLPLFAFFTMTLIPFGQTDFMVNHWMKVGAYIAPILMFFALQVRGKSEVPVFGDIHLMACILATAYLFHQAEEHWVDLLGREYPLYDVLNGMIAQLFGEDKYGVFTPSAIFYVNVGMVWTVAFLAIASAPRYVFPTIALSGIIFVNGLSHIIVAAQSIQYNSGLATSVILFVPLSMAFFYHLIKDVGLSPWVILAGIIWGLIGHVLLFAGLVAANIHQIIPVEVYYVGLVLYGLSPIFLYRAEA